MLPFSEEFPYIAIIIIKSVLYNMQRDFERDYKEKKQKAEKSNQSQIRNSNVEI